MPRSRRHVFRVTTVVTGTVVLDLADGAPTPRDDRRTLENVENGLRDVERRDPVGLLDLPEYLDSVERAAWMNYAAHIGHTALRVRDGRRRV